MTTKESIKILIGTINCNIKYIDNNFVKFSEEELIKLESLLFKIDDEILECLKSVIDLENKYDESK